MISPDVPLKTEPLETNTNNRSNSFGVIQQTVSAPPPRVHKACGNCKRSHHACDNERPCRRCLDRGLQCFDTEPKKRGRRKSGQSPETSHLEGSPSPLVAPLNQVNLLNQGGPTATLPSAMVFREQQHQHLQQMHQMQMQNQLPQMHNQLPQMQNQLPQLQGQMQQSPLQSHMHHSPMSSPLQPQMQSPSIVTDGSLLQLMNADPQLDNMFDLLFSSILDDSSRLAKRINSNADSPSSQKETIIDLWNPEDTHRLEDVFAKAYAFTMARCPDYAPVMMLQREWIDSPQVRAKFKDHVTTQNIMRQKNFLASTLAKWVDTFRSLGCPAIIWERTELVHFYNEAYRQVTGYNKPVPGHLFACEILRQLSEKSKSIYLEVQKKFFCDSVDSMVFPVELKNQRDPSGNSFVRGTFSITVRRDTLGLPLMFLGIFMEISEASTSFACKPSETVKTEMY